MRQRSATLPVADDFDVELLRRTQAYLECQSGGGTPGRELSAAWERFFAAYDPLIRRLADRFKVPRGSRDDCAQLVWLALIQKLPAFRYDPARGRFRSWLASIVRGKAIDLRRRQVRHPSDSLSAHPEASLPGRDDDPAVSYERRCRREAVWCVLGILRRQVSECNYRVLLLRCIEGRTVPETVACLGLTQAQVWYREYRMKRKFGHFFRRYAGGVAAAEGCA
jgi:RNA polymerase sigma factor (sigma-70 family)